MFHKDASQQRSDDTGGSKGEPDHALVAGPLLDFCKHVRNDDHDQREQARSAKTLDGTEKDQHGHGRGCATTDGADQEDHTGDLVQDLASKDVRDSAVNGLEGGVREHVGRGNPTHLGLSTEVRGNAGQGSGNDTDVQTG